MVSREKIKTLGFTIVELLVVIAVIGVLAAITIISYTGISGRAVTASLNSDLSNTSSQLKLFQVDNGTYPTANNCPSPAAGEICLKSSPGTTYQYTAVNNANPPTFCVTAVNGAQSYRITNDSTVAVGNCLGYGLLAYYPFDSGANDTSGNGNNGTVYGAPVLTSGTIGQAYSFSGVNDYINTPLLTTNLNIGRADAQYTMSMWVYLNKHNSSGTGVVLGTACYSGFGIFIQSDGVSYTKLTTYFRNSVSMYTANLATLNLNQWYHVAAVLDKNKSKIQFYLDGVLFNETAITVNGFANEPCLLQVNGVTQPGGNGPWTNIAGLIDDVRIYSRVLSPTEINDLHNKL